MATSDAARQAIWILRMLEDLGFKIVRDSYKTIRQASRDQHPPYVT